MKVLPVSDVKQNLEALVDQLAAIDDEIIITKEGYGVAVLISLRDYESLTETDAVRSDPQLLKEIKEGLEAFKEGRVRVGTVDELFPEDPVSQTVGHVPPAGA